MDNETPEQIRRERDTLKAHVLNMFGKFDVSENFLPRLTMDLASLHKLEIEETNAGTWVRRRNVRNMGS